MGAISGGAPFQLKFYMSGVAQLFSFWVAPMSGTSGGFMAAGGPGCDGSRSRCTSVVARMGRVWGRRKELHKF